MMPTVAIVTRKQLAELKGVNVQTIHRHFLHREWTGEGATPPGRIRMHPAAGRGGPAGYDEDEALELLASIEADRPALQNSRRWKANKRHSGWPKPNTPNETFST